MDLLQFKRIQTRRDFFKWCAGGIGTMALAHLLEIEGRTAVNGGLPDINPLRPKPPHFAPKARNVIFMFMEGAPSHLDLFDPKPEMQKWDGQPLPESMTKNLRLAFIKPNAKVWASPRVFTRHGQCGMDWSDFMPHLATCSDDICMIRSMFTEQFNHHPGQLMLNCGTPLLGRPSMGSWVNYGLGSESQNLPGFVVLSSGLGTSAGSGNWSSGFLPSTFQGVPFRNQGDPVLYLSSPSGATPEIQRSTLDAIRDLNEMSYSQTGDLEIASRIASYELAFRMQTAGPELLDFSRESPATLERYGFENELTRPFAMNCLLARRMVERGVRFVQIMHASWDDHADLLTRLRKNCDITDQPTAALLGDLKQRGLLDSTLVVWAGEFGRTPLVESRSPVKGNEGRDHHPFAFSLWLAGGGIRGGQVVGRTDDFGLNIVEDKIHIHDLHATLLHCLGFDHEKLTYRHQGRDFRLTDVAGQVVPKLLA
ncbi:MAG: DUF1501 domain-containing protein [Acidobacteriota bacterium]